MNIIFKTGERLKDFVLSHLPDDDILLLRSHDTHWEYVFVYQTTEGMNNGRKVYELNELKKSDKSFERWLISKFENKIDGKKALKELFTEELYWSTWELSLRLERMKAFNRVGYFESEDGEVIYISLHHHQEMVEITGDGVHNLKESNAPVWFMKNETMRGMATPKYELDEEDQIDVQRTISHLNDLRKYVNVSEEYFCLVIAWLLIALRSNPIIDAPILWIKGKRSSGKSTSTRFLKRLIDPDIFNMLQQSVSTRDFSAACNNQYVFAIDNVSSVTPHLNEMLCEAVTEKRAKYYMKILGTASLAPSVLITISLLNSLDTVSRRPNFRLDVLQ